MKLICIIPTIMIMILLGCGPDGSNSLPQEDESKVEYKTNLTDEDAEAKCALLTVTGCIRGQIAHATTIRVNNESFFDIDELAEYFERALVVKNLDGSQLPENSYTSQLTDSVNNENFADQFNVAAAGSERLGDARALGTSGDFLLARLPVGIYTVRVYKRINATVTFQDGTSLPYCVTIYQDASMDVIASKVANEIFDNFSLRYYQRACSSVDESYIERLSESEFPWDQYPASDEGEGEDESNPSPTSPATLQLSLGAFEKIPGLYSFESATAIGDKTFVISQKSGINYFGTIENGAYNQVALTTFAAGGITLPAYKNYHLASGIHSGSFVYLHESSTHNLIKMNTDTGVAVGSFAFDCRDTYDAIYAPENIFFDSGKWKYAYSGHQETCDFATGALTAVQEIDAIPYGALTKAGDFLVNLDYQTIYIYNVKFGEIASLTIENFPFQNDLTVVSNGDTHWLMGCRSTGCYRSELLFNWE